MPQLSLHTQIGDITVSEEDGAIVAVDWGWGRDQSETPLLRRACDQLHAYFDGELTEFDLPLAPAGTPYRRKVWQALRAIPYGADPQLHRHRSRRGRQSPLGRPGERLQSDPDHHPLPSCRRPPTHLGGYSGGEGLATKRYLLALEARAQPLLQPIPSAAA